MFPQQKKQNTGKGGKKKKQVLKFTLDCTHPVEDGIMDAANFVSPTLVKCFSPSSLRPDVLLIFSHSERVILDTNYIFFAVGRTDVVLTG